MIYYLSAGNKVLIMRAAGEFYAQDLGTGNLELLSRFFEKYPEYTDRTFLSVKVRLCLIFINSSHVRLTTLLGRYGQDFEYPLRFQRIVRSQFPSIRTSMNEHFAGWRTSRAA